MDDNTDKIEESQAVQLARRVLEFVEKLIGPSADDIPKVSKTTIDYRGVSDETFATCGNCKWFQTDGTCKIVAGDIDEDDTCNAFSPVESDHGDYMVTDEESFINGLVALQPIELGVVGGIETPEGKLILIEDGFGNTFSMELEQFVAWTATWNGWTDSDREKIEGAAQRGEGQ